MSGDTQTDGFVVVDDGPARDYILAAIAYRNALDLHHSLMVSLDEASVAIGVGGVAVAAPYYMREACHVGIGWVSLIFPLATAYSTLWDDYDLRISDCEFAGTIQ